MNKTNFDPRDILYLFPEFLIPNSKYETLAKLSISGYINIFMEQNFNKIRDKKE
jgi:hypothetical protein